MCGINYLRSEAKWGFRAAREEVSGDQLQGQRPDGIGGSIGDELIRVNHLRAMQIRTEKRDHPVLRIGFPDEGSTTSDKHLSMHNDSDGWIMSEARDATAIDNLEDTSFDFYGDVSSLTE